MAGVLSKPKYVSKLHQESSSSPDSNQDTSTQNQYSPDLRLPSPSSVSFPLASSAFPLSCKAWPVLSLPHSTQWRTCVSSRTLHTPHLREIRASQIFWTFDHFHCLQGRLGSLHRALPLCNQSSTCQLQACKECPTLFLGLGRIWIEYKCRHAHRWRLSCQSQLSLFLTCLAP